MNPARTGAVSLIVLVLASAPASADDLAVLTVGFGEAPSALLEASVRRAAATGELAPLESGVAAARVAERYGQPAGIDLAWVTAEAERGEEAYYTMRYAEAAEVFDSAEWLAAQAAVVDMALDPELAQAVRRGLMARGRAYFYAEDREGTAGAVNDAVELFPEWIPETDWYQPEYIVRYTEVRHEAVRSAGELEVSAPAGDCEFELNGLALGRGSVARSAALTERYAVRVRCDETTSRVHLVGSGSAWVDPEFDAAFDPSERRLSLPPAAASDAALLARMGRAYADVVGADRVVLAGVLPTGELQLVDVGAGEDTPRAAVRARPDQGGAFDVPTAVAALLGGARSTGVMVADLDGERLVFPGMAGGNGGGGGGPGLGTWIAFGVGGAGLIVGTVFAIVEGGKFDDYEACRDDPVCSTGPDLSSLESDRDTAALLATIGFGVGLAGVVTGVVLWVVQSGSESPSSAASDGRTPSAGWEPAVQGGVAPDGGWVGLGWRF